jgi:integrase
MARGSIKQNPKTGRWDARVSVSKRGAPRRQPRKRGFRTKALAEKWVRERLDALDEGTFVDTSDRTVAELLAADVQTQVKLGRLRSSTAENYRNVAGTLVNPAIGGVRAQDLRPGDLDRLYGDLLDRGLAPTSVHHVHTMMSGAFRRACKRQELATNPCTLSSPPSPEIPEKKTWSLGETQRFFSRDVVRADPLFPMLKLMAATGIRRGEALALSWADIDLDTGMLSVNHSAALVDGEVVIGEPKTKRSKRRVTLGADSVQLLRDHLAAQREHRVRMGSGWHDQNLVFCGVDDRPRNPASVSMAFAALVAKTDDLPRVSLHALRHQHGTLCLDQGMPPHAVAARLGHSAATLMKIYAHTGDRSQDAAAALEGLLDKTRPDLRVVGDE